ncbi:hypothetical protein QTL86_03620 [Cellulosilyticum sp. ST5]|uniref:hypothetical protein n=1 Tax=Cellulosilyticum sp. ST5 TaxID=3055805 RepID=UPI003977BB7A
MDTIVYSIKECSERYGLAYSTIGNECRRLIRVDMEEFASWTMKFYLERDIETLHDLI